MADEVLEIVQGKTFRRQFAWYDPLPDGTADLDNPTDISAYDAQFQIRHAGGTDPDVDLTIGSGLTLVKAEGSAVYNAFDVVIAAGVTADLDFGGLSSSARWEIELDSVSDPEPEWGSTRGDAVLKREVVV
jgi:hypothetical protein